MTLSLPAGRYTIDLENGSQLSGTHVILKSDYRPTLSDGSFSPITREDTRSRGSSTIEEVDPVNGYFSFFPSFPLMENRRAVHGLSISTIGDSYRVDGLDIGLASIVRDSLKGTQLTPIFGFVGGDLNGAQAAGVFNVVSGEAKGFQGAGVFNIDAHTANGAQAAGVFNLTNGDSRVVQSAGVFNINNGDLVGAQLGGVFNITAEGLQGVQAGGVFNIGSGSLRGAQLAGVFNIGGSTVTGIQGAGVFNVAGDLRGAQMSVVNVGGVVRGVQIGVVNIAREMHGLPIGLISISSNGLHNLSIWTDGIGYGYGGFQIGSGSIYTVAYAGIPLSNPSGGSGTFGLGLGMHTAIDSLWIDMDLSAKRQMDWTGDSLSVLTQMGTTQTSFPSLRGTVGYKIFKQLSILGGLTLEGNIPGVTTKSVFHSGTPWSIPMTNFGTSLELYPQWFIGIRL
jgi:hypothetical protein